MIWLCAFFIWRLGAADTRRAVLNLIRALLVRKLVIIWVCMLAYVTALTIALHAGRLWTVNNCTTTVLWTFSVAFVTLANANVIAEEPYFFRNFALAQLKVAVIFQFVASLYVFSLWIEILIAPVLMILTVILIVSEYHPEYKQVRNLITLVLTVLGVGLLAYSLTEVFRNYDESYAQPALRDLLLPAIMSIGFIPFVYVIATTVAYDNAFIRINIFIKDKELATYAKLQTALRLHLRFKVIEAWARRIPFAGLTTRQDVVAELRQLKDQFV